MGLIIAGERSGVGKTTVTLALLAFLVKQAQVQSFKVGPDYIDPMFHGWITGRQCRNLDPLLTSEAYVQTCFYRHQEGCSLAVVEGVMGLFDGVGGTDYGSTAHVARLLHLPILLVLDCSRLSRSVAAIAHGYCTFDPHLHIAGLVLNRVGSDRHLESLKEALQPLQIPILGVLHRQDDITIPDRHLGLVPTAELDTFPKLVDRLAQLGKHCFDWPTLFPLLSSHFIPPTPPSPSPPHLPTPPPPCRPHFPSLIRLAIASDRAFSFYYPDNLDQLRMMGAELVFWSPLEDKELPEQIQGLYFGGGFPEVFAAELAANQAAQRAVRQAIQSGIPTYAECGGLMYLCQHIVDFSGQAHAMVGILPTTAQMSARLTLGYRQATVLQDSPLLPRHTSVVGHEFHRSELTAACPFPLYQTTRYQTQTYQFEGWRSHQLHASYLHLHWGARPEIPQRFLHHCRAWETTHAD